VKFLEAIENMEIQNENICQEVHELDLLPLDVFIGYHLLEELLDGWHLKLESDCF
jgi:hypothetical protein